MEDIKLAKKELRNAMKSRLAAVSPEEAEKASRMVLEKLESLDQWKNSEVVLAFLSMKDELDTARVIRKALEPGKTVAVPRVAGSDLVFCRIEDIEKDREPPAGSSEHEYDSWS